MPSRVALLALPSLLAAATALADPGMTWRDVVEVRKIFSEVISADGSWIALEARPDRGDGQVLFLEAGGRSRQVVERGRDPQLSVDGEWGAAVEQPTFEERETAGEEDELLSTLVLVDLGSGERSRFEKPEDFAFSSDGRWFAVRVEAPEEEEEGAEAADPAAGEEEEDGEEPEPRDAGSPLTLVRLSDGARFEFEDVARFAWSEKGAWLAAVEETASGLGNRFFVLECGESAPVETVVDAADSTSWDGLRWAEELPLLAAVAADTRDPEDPVDARLLEFDARTGTPATRAVDADFGEDWTLPLENELRFSRDGARLFFGLRERAAEDEDSDDDEEPFDPFDVDAILAEREVDVWHWKDPRIKTHERETWEERSKHRYLAVCHRDDGTVVRLAGPALPEVFVPDEGLVALAEDTTPYLPLITWDGWYEDVWTVDLRDGSRVKVATRVQDSVSRSPAGNYVVWFADGEFLLHDVATGERRSLTASLDVPFADEDHDYPRTPPDYGIGGWMQDESAVFLYDKYDIWRCPTDGGAPMCLTAGRGREEGRTWRIVDLDHGREGLAPGETLLLTGFDETDRNSSVWTVDPDGSDLKRRREDARYYRIRAKAEEADRYLYSEESYTEFGDLWVADSTFRHPRRVTDLNPQLDDFDLGEPGLVSWLSDDGVELEGILIKPANYDPDRRYPVLVYYYRFFTPRLNWFNDPVINHRPSFYAYAGDGYAIFLPDIRFEVGRPGHSAAGSLVPGVHKLIDMGIADPEAIALHGHSWSGYQTAQIITETDLFACAVAGAPVSNMTSAYGGIRYGSGLSRQFQYEKSQSRIGASLWDRRDLYIENSPVFYADRIDTPLLIQFGDEDEAVPWTQGIELYMAMRRLGKPCVFLQYRGEPHHLKKYPNKLDYTLRMKAFIDHFCKGAPAPSWWTDGEPYEGE